MKSRHTLLFEAIVAGDAEAAARVMREHVESSLGAKSAWRLAESAEDPA